MIKPLLSVTVSFILLVREEPLRDIIDLRVCPLQYLMIIPSPSDTLLSEVPKGRMSSMSLRTFIHSSV